MERQYTVEAGLDVWVAAESESDAKEKVHKELDDAGQEVLQLKMGGTPVSLSPATLRAIRTTITNEMISVDMELDKESMRESRDHEVGIFFRDNVREEIANKKALLTRILEKIDELYDKYAIYVIEATMTVDVYAESDREALEAAAEEIENPWREVFEVNIEEIR